jgi:hypothetical protein
MSGAFTPGAVQLWFISVKDAEARGSCYRDAILIMRLIECMMADVEEVFVDRRTDTRPVGEHGGLSRHQIAYSSR